MQPALLSAVAYPFRNSKAAEHIFWFDFVRIFLVVEARGESDSVFCFSVVT